MREFEERDWTTCPRAQLRLFLFLTAVPLPVYLSVIALGWALCDLSRPLGHGVAISASFLLAIAAVRWSRFLRGKFHHCGRTATSCALTAVAWCGIWQATDRWGGYSYMPSAISDWMLFLPAGMLGLLAMIYAFRSISEKRLEWTGAPRVFSLIVDRIVPPALILMAIAFVFLAFGNPQWSRFNYCFQAGVFPHEAPELPRNYTGIWRKWHGNFRLKYEIPYRLKYEIPYRNGAIHGTLRKWYSNGRQEQEWPHQDGKLHGLCITWDKEGRAQMKAYFKNGKQVTRH